MNKFKRILRIFLTLSLILSVMSNSLYAKDFTVESGKLFNENNKIVKRVVEENNIERIVESKEPSYTVIIMDMSGTMDGKPEKEQRKTVKNFYKSVVKANSENKVALISIDSVFVLNTSRVLCDFTNDLEELNKGMEENTVPLGKSYFDYGLNKSESLFKEVEAQKNKKVIKNIVICSDGIPSGGLEETEKGMYSKSDHENYKIANEVYNITKKLKENGITIYTVGFFQNLEGKELAFGERFMKDIAGKGEYKEDNADSNKGNNKDNENKRNENNRNDYGHNNKNNGNNKRDDVNPDKDKKDPDSGKSEPNIDNFPEYESEDKDPIIIIPGIMGSRLFISEDYSDNTKAWDPDAGLLRLTNNVIMLRERLKPNNHLYVRPCENQQKYSEGDKDGYGREYGSEGAYKTLVDSICKRFPKREVYVFSYDWRKSNSVSAEKLNEEIKKILKQTGKETVDIVAHSMGGLVASSYYSKYGSEKVDKIITCGTPYEGAPLLINSIMNWDILAKPQDFFGLNDLRDWALGLIGGVQRKLKVSFNGVAELMPTKNYVSKFPMKQDSWKPLNKGDYDLSYEDYVTKHCNRIFGKENYSSALNFQNSILENGYNKLLNHYRSYFLIGTNQKTVTSIKFQYSRLEEYWNGVDEKYYETDLNYSTLGDGTVPYYSASISEKLGGIHYSARVKISDANHGDVVEKKDCIDWILYVLSGKADYTSWQVSSVQDKPVIDLSKEKLSEQYYVVLRLTGPVDITTTKADEILSSDKNNLKLRSNYGRLDILRGKSDIKMLCLDDNSDINIKLIAKDKGTMNYTIRYFDRNDKLLDERSFEIPVTKGMAIKTGINKMEDTVLQVDKDKDGKVDEDISATENEKVKR